MSSYSTLFSVLAYYIILFIVSTCCRHTAEIPQYGVDEVICPKHDNHIFNKVNRVCEDCYYLYRDMELYNYCRQDCFKSEYFDACFKVLMLDGKSQYLDWIKELRNGTLANVALAQSENVEEGT